MAVITFDTFKASKALSSAGFKEQEAEAIVSVIRESVSENVATKEDIARLEVRMMIGLFAVSGLVIGASGTVIAALSFILGN